MKKPGTFRKTFLFYFITLLLGLIVWVATNTDFYTLADGIGPGSSENLLFGLLICGAGLIFCSPLLIPIFIYFYFLHRWKKAKSVSFKCTVNVLFGLALSSGWALLLDHGIATFYQLWPFIFGACAAGVIVEIISMDSNTLLADQKPVSV